MQTTNKSLEYKKAGFFFLTLLLAGLYNILWGAWVIFFPELSFSLHGMEIPRYIEIWQCVGMIVGVYGIGYILAASDPIKHWPIVLVGFLGKVFGPIGFVNALVNDVFPPSFFINIIFNDLIWWVPFFLILKEAFILNQKQVEPIDPASLNLDSKGLIVALRHQGCTFTRENLFQLNKELPSLKEKGYTIYVLHMGQNEEIRPLLDEYLDSEVTLLSDPEGRIYRGFKLEKGKLSKLFGLKEFYYGFLGFLKGRGLGPLRGDGMQLGGLFTFENGKFKREFISSRASDVFPFASIR